MAEYFLRTLFVHTPGTRLILEGGAVKALRDDVPPRRLPLRAIDSIVVAGGVDVSTPLMLKCAGDGRLVVFINRIGGPRAIVEGPASGRGQLRRLQYAAHADPVMRDAFAGAIVQGKLAQMGWALRQWARDAHDATAAKLRALSSELVSSYDATRGASRGRALGLEGAGTRAYFVGLGLALRELPWQGRNRRPATDPVNCALSFLYGMQRAAVHGGVHASGLDAFTGFLHGDLDGQPSLVLDMLEEFRPSVDRLVVSAFNRRQLREEHFATEITGAVRLTDSGREAMFEMWHKHRERSVTVQGSSTPILNASIPIIQANRLANALRRGQIYEAHRLVVR